LVTDIVRLLDPGAVDVELGTLEAVSIESGRSHFSVRTLPREEFPRLVALSGKGMTLNAATLGAALRQVVRAASTDDSRPILTGVLMAANEDGMILVATDSYRLAVRKLPGASVLSTGQRVIIPSRAFSELQRLLGTSGDVVLYLGDYQASFELGMTRLTTRLIDQEYPNYEKLIQPGYPNKLMVNRESMLDAIRRVKLMARDATTSVRIALRPDVIACSVVTPDLGEANEEIDVKYEGDEMTIAFNPTYLVDGVEAIESDDITLEIQDAAKAVVIRARESPAGSGEYLYLLMPVRV